MKFWYPNWHCREEILESHPETVRLLPENPVFRNGYVEIEEFQRVEVYDSQMKYFGIEYHLASACICYKPDGFYHRCPCRGDRW